MIGHMFEKFRKTIVIIRIENVIFAYFSLSFVLQLGYILVGLSRFIDCLIDWLILRPVTARSLIDRWKHILLLYSIILLNFITFYNHVLLF